MDAYLLFSIFCLLLGVIKCSSTNEASTIKNDFAKRVDFLDAINDVGASIRRYFHVPAHDINNTCDLEAFMMAHGTLRYIDGTSSQPMVNNWYLRPLMHKYIALDSIEQTRQALLIGVIKGFYERVRKFRPDLENVVIWTQEKIIFVAKTMYRALITFPKTSPKYPKIRHLIKTGTFTKIMLGTPLIPDLSHLNTALRQFYGMPTTQQLGLTRALRYDPDVLIQQQHFINYLLNIRTTPTFDFESYNQIVTNARQAFAKRSGIVDEYQINVRSRETLFRLLLANHGLSCPGTKWDTRTNRLFQVKIASFILKRHQYIQSLLQHPMIRSRKSNAITSENLCLNETAWLFIAKHVFD